MSDITTLKACSVFRGFSESGLVLMGKLAHQRSIPASTPIFVEQMVADSMFVVRTGVVRLQLKSSSGQDKVLDRLATGDSFGELSLLVGGHRMVSAIAETDCELLEISRREFSTMQKQKPQACLKLMISIVETFGRRLLAAKEYIRPLLSASLGE